MNVSDVLAKPLSEELPYVEAARKVVPAEQMPGWEAEVRKLYQQMVTITVTPDWAKLLDFETTLPQAVEDLVKAYGDPR